MSRRSSTGVSSISCRPPPENKIALQGLLQLAFDAYLSRNNGGVITKDGIVHDERMNGGESVEIDAVVSVYQEFVGAGGVSSTGLAAVRNEVLSKCNDRWPTKALAFTNRSGSKKRKSLKSSRGGGGAGAGGVAGGGSGAAGGGGAGGGGEKKSHKKKKETAAPPRVPEKAGEKRAAPETAQDPLPILPAPKFVTAVVTVPGHVRPGERFQVLFRGAKNWVRSTPTLNPNHAKLDH